MDCDDSDWDAAFRKEQDLSQQESEEMASACDARSESASESESESSTTSNKKLASWWAQVLVRAVESLGWTWPAKSSSALQVVSGCTGCSAEASVLKARLFELS